MIWFGDVNWSGIWVWGVVVLGFGKPNLVSGFGLCLIMVLLTFRVVCFVIGFRFWIWFWGFTVLGLNWFRVCFFGLVFVGASVWFRVWRFVDLGLGFGFRV